MNVKQFKDGPLAHFSYAIVSNGEMAVIDPSRNPLPYYQYAEENNAKIIAVFETHPHADFVSGHLQISKETGATIYVSEKIGAEYPHTAFDEGQEMKIGEIMIQPIHTPGHSPDSMTFVARENNETILFTGDTLFIGNVGRPDLREKAGNMKALRTELAKAMYQTMQTKFNEFSDETLVYPAHGAGSLCGKNMSKANSSTIGNERMGNWAFQKQTEAEFVEEILKDQPFVPAYFGFDVDMNRKGAENMQESIYSVPMKISSAAIEDGITIVDVRNGDAFKKSHLPNSINIMARSESDKYETWLGAIIRPEEPFYLVVESVNEREQILERTAKIGYEKQVKGILTLPAETGESSDQLDLEKFKKNKDNYTILDIRNNSELAEGKIFENAIAIPLNELRGRVNEIPSEKPVVIHCAGGYRSTAGSSILENTFKNQRVYDLGEAIKDFK
ncbi:MAG TPA: rhodanese-like domain-containing protein [Flavobacteriaceae bacterium]|nr:rhodanese-like domain-containing protein [Flavobacteriaceae bacterium]